jgi:hypothetical protein
MTRIRIGPVAFKPPQLLKAKVVKRNFLFRFLRLTLLLEK